MKNPFVFGRLKEEDPRREALEATIKTVFDELEEVTADVNVTIERL
ncbi:MULTISPECIES: hypothetical protein [Bacillaceae]|nr:MULTISPECIES: hypothetical protein [Bacillaceae]